MAIPEACGLWIEQRVQEELETKGETGASLREIGRRVASEVEKYFETKVSPNTIYQKARREHSGTNVPVLENHVISDSNEKLEKLEKTHGGPREGAGRKPKKQPRPDPYFNPESVISEEFAEAFDAFIKEVATAKKENWETTSKEAVSQCIKSIKYYLGD